MVVEQEVSAAAQRRPAESDSAARLREIEPMVRGICRGRLGDADGDDAAQRALLTIWRKLESDRGVDCLPTYAATCARYETLSAYRRFDRSTTPAGDLSEALWADTDPGPAEHAERMDEIAHARERVEALLAQLSPRQVEVMRASVLADRTSADAAAELRITPTGVRAAQVRAMARMRELSGTQSPNPQALNLSSVERGKRDWEAEKTRRSTPIADFRATPQDGDPLVQARTSAEALDVGREASAHSVDDSPADPMDRARAAVEALPAADDIRAGASAAPAEFVRSEDGMETSAAFASDQPDHNTDAAGAP